MSKPRRRPPERSSGYIRQRNQPAAPPDGRCHHQAGACDEPALPSRRVCARHAARLAEIGAALRAGGRA